MVNLSKYENTLSLSLDIFLFLATSTLQSRVNTTLQPISPNVVVTDAKYMCCLVVVVI